MVKPQAYNRWLLCLFFFLSSHKGQTRYLLQKITSCLPSPSALGHATGTVPSKSNGYICQIAGTSQCSVPSERSIMHGISESSTATINQVCLLHRRNNSCPKESKPLYLMRHLESDESPGVVLFRIPS